MDAKRMGKRLTTLLQNFVLIIFIVFVFSYVWYSTFSDTILLPFWHRGNLLLFVIYASIFVILQYIQRANKLGYQRASDVAFGNLLALIISNLFIYLQSSLIAREFLTLIPFIYMTLIQVAFVVVWAFFSKWIYTKMYPPRKMLMIIGRKEGKLLKYKMDFDPHQFDISEYIYVEDGLSLIFERIKQFEEVIISDVKSMYRNEILKECYRLGKRVFMTPKISDVIIRSSENILLYDTPLLMAKSRGLSTEQRAIKRIFDIVSSLLAIVALSPLFLIISLSIYLYDKGPVLYTQDRLTRGGKVFKIYKFRSMVVDSEKHGARLASKNDDRITPVGKILRKTHVDELPQLLNILLGDMSVVGPRPERPDIAKEYEETIPEFPFRLKVKAGLSGYAQVYGQYNTTPYDKLKHDIFYIENYSLWLDIVIILLTVKIMFQSEKSEGVSDDQTTALIDMDMIDEVKNNE